MTITNERWLELREVPVDHLIKQKQGMDFIQWGDIEALMRQHLTDDELVPWESWVSDSTVFVQFVGYPVYSLAITDLRNTPIREPNCADIENVKQRAFVKAVARSFGLGHSLYEGTTYSSSYTDKNVSAAPRNTTRRSKGLF